MRYAVRIYDVKPGALEAFVAEWREHVKPLRERFGFRVLDGWAGEDGRTFIWVLTYEGDFEAADRAYYESAERAALDPDPARHLETARQVLATRVHPPE